MDNFISVLEGASFLRTDKTAVLLDLAVAAGSFLKQWRGGEEDIRYKADHSPVTEADLEANRIIEEGLRRVFPDIPVVAEETYGGEPVGDCFFLVDPLDGTREFVKGFLEYTVNIAFMENNQPREGVVYAPALDLLFWGAKGCGAYGRSLDAPSPWQALPSAHGRKDEGKWGVVTSRFHGGGREQDGVCHVRKMGSSLKFCWLAKGKADLYPRLGTTMEWDTAAGDIILREAGGEILSLDTFEPLVYGKQDQGLKNGAFLALGPRPGVEKIKT